MDFGRIQGDSCKEIVLADWLRVITEHPALQHMPDRDATNPFTNERILVPGRGGAFHVVEGKRLGNATLEDGQILTTGIPRDICEEIAERLGGRAFEDDRT